MSEEVLRTSKTLMIKEHLESSVLFHTFIETKGVRIYWIWGFGVYSILGNTWSSWSTCWECICENIFNSDQELRKSHSVVVWLCVWFLWILHSIFTQTSCCLSVSQLSHCSLSAFSQQTLSSLLTLSRLSADSQQTLSSLSAVSPQSLSSLSAVS